MIERQLGMKYDGCKRKATLLLLDPLHAFEGVSATDAQAAVRRLNACTQGLEQKLKISRTDVADLSNEEYFVKADKESPGILEIPPDLKDPKLWEMMRTFEATARSNQTNPTAVAAEFEKIRKQIIRGNPAAKVLLYSSPQVPSLDFPSTMGRILVMIPGQTQDKYIQFSVAEPDQKFNASAVSIVSVDRTSKPNQTYFWDYMRGKNGTLISNAKGPNRCASCHGNGPMPIDPVPYGNSSEFTDLKAINDRMDSVGYAPAAHSSPLIEGAPFFGAGSIEQRRRLPKDCQSVTAYMSCTNCHNQAMRGGLAPGNGEGYMFQIVNRGKMPPGANLNEKERRLLYQCLKQEYFGYTPDQKASLNTPSEPGLLNQFLTSVPCPTELRNAGTIPSNESEVWSRSTKPVVESEEPAGTTAAGKDSGPGGKAKAKSGKAQAQ